jgi:photosystem II stability/assembly factor-like uncharacterized protein
MLIPRIARPLLGSLVLAAALPAEAARKSKTPDLSPVPNLSEQFKGLEFRNIGPFSGGRVTAVAGVAQERFTFYFGSTGGGVWKTTDGGLHWEPTSDKDFKTGSVGALAVAPSDPNVIYAGMGESPIRGNLSHGDGVYKSTDGGRHWTHLGLAETHQISRIAVDPRDPDRVYVAAQGHPWGPNPDRGIYRSEDGGKSWKKVLFVSDRTGACDLSMDPLGSRTLYAAFWQVARKPWSLEDGGPESGIYKSIDGGDSWKKLSKGLPEGPLGRIGVAASAARPGLVWALIEAKKGGVFRSEDGGESWKRVSGAHKLRERAWYYSWIYADPKRADTVYIPNVEFYRSTDGGKSFDKVSVPHGDNHDLWIDPNDPDRLIVGNDGGATVSFDGGRTWSTQLNQPTGQFYRVATDNRYPYWLYGAQQDRESVAIPSGVPGESIDRTDWYSVGDGEAGWVAPDPKDPQIVYAPGYPGQLTVYDRRTRQTRSIDPWPQLTDGRALKDLKYRFNWSTPIVVSRYDSKTLYYPAQKLLKSTDGGMTWEEISPDLTRNDPTKQGYSGGQIQRDISGAEFYDTINCLAESPFDRNTLWVGSDDGLVHMTRDGGQHWADVTPKGLPEWIEINSIELSPTDPATAYIAANMHEFDDFRPYIFKTHDAGKTWTSIVAGIPAGAFARVVRQDPARPELLYAGTETGLFLSFDGGGRWQPFQLNLPVVPITDLQLKDGDLVVATQGRAFWILDDVSPLRQWKESIAGEAAHLFAPRTAYRIEAAHPEHEETPPPPVGKNIPNGVLINYWLKDKPGETDPVTLEILAYGQVIRKITNQKSNGEKAEEKNEEECPCSDLKAEKEKHLEPKAGVNRFLWDFRTARPILIPKSVFDEGTKKPPRVAPGAYEARLTSAGQSQTVSFQVDAPPDLPVTAADLEAQYDLLAKISADLSETHATVLKIRDILAQVAEITRHAAQIGRGEPLEAAARVLRENLEAVAAELTNPEIQADEDDLNYEPRLDHEFTYLAGEISSAEARPTGSETKYYEVLREKLDAIEKRFAEIRSQDLDAFNRAVAAERIPPVVTLERVDGAAR